MQAIYFLLVAVALYWLADRLLERIESARGKRLEHRTIVFFFLLLGLALLVFPLMRQLTDG